MDLVPLFSKGRRFRSDALPIKELVSAGPGVDLGAADPTIETTGALVLMLLLGRGVIHPAARAGKLFGRPDAVGHLLKPADGDPFPGCPGRLTRIVTQGPFKDSNRIAANSLTHGLKTLFHVRLP